MHWGCARFDSLVVEFQGGVFLCQFGTDTQARPLRFAVDYHHGLQKLFLEHGQCGVRICGGAGGLEHTRRCLGF